MELTNPGVLEFSQELQNNQAKLVKLNEEKTERDRKRKRLIASLGREEEPDTISKLLILYENEKERNKDFLKVFASLNVARRNVRNILRDASMLHKKIVSVQTLESLFSSKAKVNIRLDYRITIMGCYWYICKILANGQRFFRQTTASYIRQIELLQDAKVLWHKKNKKGYGQLIARFLEEYSLETKLEGLYLKRIPGWANNCVQLLGPLRTLLVISPQFTSAGFASPVAAYDETVAGYCAGILAGLQVISFLVLFIYNFQNGILAKNPVGYLSDLGKSFVRGR